MSALLPRENAPTRVLIVDDEESIRDLLGDFFQRVNIEAVLVDSIEKAHKEVEAQEFGLLIIDVMISTGNGLVVAKSARLKGINKNTPILIISGKYCAEDMIKVKGAFTNCEILTKPFRIEDLQKFSASAFPDNDFTLTSSTSDTPPAVEKESKTEPETSEKPAKPEENIQEEVVVDSETTSGIIDWGYEVNVNHEEMEVKLIAYELSPELVTTREEVDGILSEQKVFKGIDNEAISAAFEGLPTLKESGTSFLIAKGLKPIHGKPGKIDFKVDISGKAKYNLDSEDDEPIDYKNATQIVMVHTGDVIAEVIPPEQGEPGYTLSGKELLPRKTKTAVLRAGSGTETDKEERFFRATEEGRPIYFGGTIQVSPVYEVGGDVDLSVGNIKFSGHVVIRGGVQDDFRIECNSAEIGGVVGSATIKCATNLTIRGGINGHDKAEIFVGGNAEIKYLNQVQITVEGDLAVTREMVNSRIWCLGKVQAGKIIGGECLGLRGVEAKILGSELGVNTIIEPGTNFKVREKEQSMAVLAEQIEGLLRPITPFFGDRKRYKSLPDEKKEEYCQALETFLTLKESHDKLSRERFELMQDEDLEPVKEVVVRRTMHSDVLIKTSSCMKHFKNDLTGPLALIEDMQRGTIRPATYVPGKGVVEDEEEE